MSIEKEQVIAQFKALQAQMPGFEVVEDDRGALLIHNKDDRPNMSYIGWTENVRGMEFVARKRGGRDKPFWTLDEALAYFKGGSQ